MIVEWFLSVAADFVEWLVGLLPAWEVPAWFLDVGTTISNVTDKLDGLGVWVQWDVLNGCLQAVLGAWVLFAGIKLVRAALGHAPGVGGNG